LPLKLVDPERPIGGRAGGEPAMGTAQD
jgi:hypothetical protein